MPAAATKILASTGTATAAASPPTPPAPSQPLASPQPRGTSFGSSAGGSLTNTSGGRLSWYSADGAAGTGGSDLGQTPPNGGSRRPSPWHDIAHSLSTTSLPPSSRNRSSTPASLPSTPPFTPHTPSDTESQALRDWDRLLAQPNSDVTRHALVTTPGAASGSPSILPTGTPKLAAERDKEGHIEYKLKLIEPSAERFEKLVTQMMWRLKQGRNEAIYELGLADDGTVIGLTRAEMDASLQTLERMASEVGATVIVLKEIVLPPSISVPASPGPVPHSVSPTAPTQWWARRPDLDENGKPRKGTRGLGGVLPEIRTRKERQASKVQADDGDPFGFGDDANGGTGASVATSDDEPTPFHLDMDDGPRPDPAVDANGTRLSLKKRKAAARREQRRLDLLRGDGTSPMPYTGPGRSSSVVADLIGHAPNTAVLSAAHLPHQPPRPSSLRLARTHSGMVAASASASHPAAETSTPDDTFIDGLMLPLDSLSLSFADVTTMDDAPTAVASPEDDKFLSAEEMICVEALVVRKPQNDEWGCEPEERGWAFGGEDDGWGFGGTDE